MTPKNADKALAGENEHWIGDQTSTDRDKFNAVFQPDVDRFNAKQTRPSRKMGPESTSPERQKSYYDGIIDGTFCYGTGDQQETPIQETVLQIGNKDDNGITDSSFDIKHWQKLKWEGHEDEASAYALEHLSRDPDKERSKRILRRATERIANLDPEHLVVLRADYHGDEPCGTGHVHISYVLRATGYKQGMESRVASVKALEQMGFKKEKGKEFGIVQLHEKIKDIIAEEMAADALEYGYEPMTRKAGSGEHRKHSDVDTFREMAEREENLIRQEAGLQLERENLDDLRVKQEDTQKKLDNRDKNQRRLVNAVYRVLHELGDNRTKFSTYAEMVEAVKAAKQSFVDAATTEARQKAQEEAAAEFQRKEDALEAQKIVLDTQVQKASEEYQAYKQAKAAWQKAVMEIPVPETFNEWMKREKVFIRGTDGKPECHTIADLWEEHQRIRRTDTRFFRDAEEISQQAEDAAANNGRRLPGE